ncbi:MAG: hypothetical protein ABII27_05725 [bacterium]
MRQNITQLRHRLSAKLVDLETRLSQKEGEIKRQLAVLHKNYDTIRLEETLEETENREKEEKDVAQEKILKAQELRDKKLFDYFSSFQEEYKSQVNKLQQGLAESLNRESKLASVLEKLEDDIKKEHVEVNEADNNPESRVEKLEEQQKKMNFNLDSLKEQLKEKENNLKDLVRSTSGFLDSALKQEQSRITGLADKTARVLVEKKEYEIKLKALAEEYAELKNEFDRNKKSLVEAVEENKSLKERIAGKKIEGISSLVQPNEQESDLSEHIARLRDVLEEKGDDIESVGTQVSESEILTSRDNKDIFPEPLKEMGELKEKKEKQEKVIVNELKEDEVKTYEERVAKESIAVINKFVGWLGEPAVDVEPDDEAENTSSKDK